MVIERNSVGCPGPQDVYKRQDMKISLLNDGPFTILLDSEEIC